MEDYKRYFTKWLERRPDKASEKYRALQRMQEMYDRAEEGFDNRFEDPNNFNMVEDCNESLKKLEAEWKVYQQDPELKKMAYLTKGHILLRKGQYQGEKFFDPQDCYQQACIVLRQGYDPKGTDFLNLLIQLTLGKYFCATAKHNQRSDYRRALDEFREVRKKIEDSREGRFSDWDTHLWLDASVYMGIAERYLYRLKSAKIQFLRIIRLILEMSRNELFGNGKFSALGSGVFINRSLDAYLASLKTEDGLKDRLGRNLRLHEGYLIEALVQLVIAYQKSRDYQIAQDICVTILKADRDNIDTANNLGVCLRKQGIKERLREYGRSDKNQYGFQTGDSFYFDYTYERIFHELAGKGNRFARLHDIKCNMYEGKKAPEEVRKDIEELLKKNPGDQEVRLLEGLYYQRQEKLETSQKILKTLYLEAPHVAKGTISLKAYYNMAVNLLRAGNFREAIKYYERIQEECTKGAESTETEEENCAIPGVRLEDLPRGDLLAKIDEGRCLMSLGDYERARECYEAIKTQYKGMDDRVRPENGMKVHNNLAECLLHLAAGSSRRWELLEEAQKELLPVYIEDPNNPIVNRHLGYFHKMKSRLALPGESRKEEINAALEHFEKAELYSYNDVYVNAGWVAAALDLLRKTELSREERQELIQKIENKLIYSSGLYSIRACSRLASFIKILEGEQDYDHKKLEKMYRSLARIRLYEEEEGYNQFRYFMENDIFRRLKATKRGELLVSLFYIYDQIMQIKEICRFVPGEGRSGMEYVIPVHYTSLRTLKKLLPDTPDRPGRLRLWNTVYMNDSFEGEAFMEMMEQVGEECPELVGQAGTARDKMKDYFHHLDKQGGKGEVLNPVNENIYVTSFSMQKDNIYMWVPYADDAKGCSLTFAADFFDIRRYGDDLTDVSCYSDSDYPLYQIQYLNEERLEQWKNGKKREEVFGDDKKIIKILSIMEEIWKAIHDLEKRMSGRGALELTWGTSESSRKETDLIHSFVAGCLNEVRFLFKSSEYAHEAEVRMFHYSYEPRMDMENFEVPRLYVEVDRKIRIKEVKLGSKISESQTNEIVSWLTKTNAVERITKSERHYK